MCFVTTTFYYHLLDLKIYPIVECRLSLRTNVVSRVRVSNESDSNVTQTLTLWVLPWPMLQTDKQTNCTNNGTSVAEIMNALL